MLSLTTQAGKIRIAIGFSKSVWWTEIAGYWPWSFFLVYTEWFMIHNGTVSSRWNLFCSLYQSCFANSVRRWLPRRRKARWEFYACCSIEEQTCALWQQIEKTAWNLQYQTVIMMFVWRLSTTTGILANHRLIPHHCFIFYPDIDIRVCQVMRYISGIDSKT